MARTPRSAAEKLAMRKKKSRTLLLFNITAFSIVVIGAILLCIFVFFKVGEVQITADAGYNEDDIRRVCGINTGDNLVLMETESREQALEHRFPYIESAKIVKHIPSTVTIEITPAETVFSVACSEGYLYVSASGKVLEIAAKPYEGSIVVLGASPKNTKPSTMIDLGEDESVKEVFTAIAEQIAKNDTKNVTEINMSNLYDLTLTYDNRITFRFGNMNSMSYKMAFGLEMLRQMEESGEITDTTVGTIDLSVVPDKNKAFYSEDRTSGDTSDTTAAGRTDSTASNTGGTDDTNSTDNTTGTDTADSTDNTDAAAVDDGSDGSADTDGAADDTGDQTTYDDTANTDDTAE